MTPSWPQLPPRVPFSRNEHRGSSLPGGILQPRVQWSPILLSARDGRNSDKGVLLKKKYLLILLCVVIMLFNELARQASECFAFLSSGVRPRNVAFREFCISAGSIISQEPSAAQEYKRGPTWMDSLFVLIQIVNVPLCG